MRAFRRSRTPILERPSPAEICQRCLTEIPMDGRAVQAQSIIEGAPPAFFHIACAPPPDSLRWRNQREMPMRAVRDDHA
jgi:hypothetical protein